MNSLNKKKEMWEKISKGELPLEAARKDAENFHRQISEPEKEDCEWTEKAVQGAMASMRMEGFVFTDEEEVMFWKTS